jgi:Ran GTPase-activating protein (RanGAP) involved in mRNA processing and transport
MRVRTHRYQSQPGTLYPETLDLSHALPGPGAAAPLAAALQHMPRLRRLLLRANALSDAALTLLLSPMLRSMPSQRQGTVQVTTLDLCDNRLGLGAIKALQPLLSGQEQQHGELQSHHMHKEHLHLQEQVEKQSEQQQQQQQWLSVSPPSGRCMLLQLMLCGNPIGDEAAGILCSLIASGNSPLQMLDLNGCGLSPRVASGLRGLLVGAR